MSIIKNKDIYDPSQGDPLEPLYKLLEKLDGKIDAVKKNMVSFEQAVKNVNKTGSGEEAKQTVKTTEKLKNETEKLTKLQQVRNKIEDSLKNVLAQNLVLSEKKASILAKGKVQLEIRNKQLKEEAKLTSSLTGAYEKESIKLNQLRRAYKDLAVQEKGATKEGQALLKNIQALDKKLKDIDASVGQFQRSVGNYEKALSNLGNELMGAAGITVGIAGAIQAFQNFEKRASDLIKITNQITNQFGLTGQSAKDLSSDILAISNIFEKDYKEVMTAANTVSKSFGISLDESIALIEQGFKKGSDNSGQFLDMLKEYPTQFKAAGIDAKQMFAIINQQVTQGIYNDKGVDTIKEAGLRLRENTKAVQEALAPLDASIKQQIKQEIAAGNSFKAIQLVSRALSDTSLTAEQTQKIIADVFGGPGEDAGLDYIKTLKDVQLNLDGVADQAGLVKNANLELSKSYNRFVQSVADGNGIISKAWAGVLDYADSYLKNLTQINAESVSFKDRMISIMDALVPILDPLKKLLGLQKDESKNNYISETRKRISELDAQIKKSKENIADYDKKLNTLNETKGKKTGTGQSQYATNLENQGVSSPFSQQMENEIEMIRRKELTQAESLQNIAALETQANIDGLKRMTDYLTEVQEKRKKDAEDEAELMLKRQKLLEETISVASEAFGELLASGEMSYKEFGKFILKTALDIAEKMILLSIAEIFTNEIKRFGPAGIGTGAILIGLVKGVFAGIKSQVQNFADGTEFVNGPGTETSDSIPARLSKGERIVPAAINKQLMGIPNQKLPLLLNAGYQSMKMEYLLNQIDKNTRVLQHGRNDWTDNGFKYWQEWNTGTIKRRKLND